jgi:hypothetical protein
MRDVESLCEKAGLGNVSKSTAQRICTELRERFEQFKRHSLYDIRLVALFLDATFLAVRADGPKEGVLVAWGQLRIAGRRVLSPPAALRRTPATDSTPKSRPCTHVTSDLNRPSARR